MAWTAKKMRRARELVAFIDRQDWKLEHYLAAGIDVDETIADLEEKAEEILKTHQRWSETINRRLAAEAEIEPTRPWYSWRL